MTMTEAIKAGDTIRVAYIGKFENGDVFDTSEGKSPLEFTVGSGNIIQGFEDAVIGMREGEKKTVTLAPDEGYGVRSDDLVFDISKNSIPAGLELEVGKMIQLTNQSGQKMPGVVSDIGDGVVTIDANHPLAGKNLVFDIEVVEAGL
jgi:peptidylprolyl isomerase